MLHKQAVDHPVPPSHPRTKKMGMIMVNIQTMVVTMCNNVNDDDDDDNDADDDDFVLLE